MLSKSEQHRIVSEWLEKYDPVALFRSALPRVYAAAVEAGMDEWELLSACNMGLLRAAEKFDPARGNSLSTYALPCMRTRVAEELRVRPRGGVTGGRGGNNRLGPRPDKPVGIPAAATAVVFEFLACDDDQSGKAEQNELAAAVREAIDGIAHPLKREVVRRRYAIGGHYSEWSAVSEELGIHDRTARKHMVDAVEYLRDELYDLWQTYTESGT